MDKTMLKSFDPFVSTELTGRQRMTRLPISLVR